MLWLWLALTPATVDEKVGDTHIRKAVIFDEAPAESAKAARLQGQSVLTMDLRWQSPVDKTCVMALSESVTDYVAHMDKVTRGQVLGELRTVKIRGHEETRPISAEYKRGTLRIDVGIGTDKVACQQGAEAALSWLDYLAN